MRKPKQILDKRLQAFYIIFDEKIPDKSIAFIIGAMQEYAEEYHRAELLKLNKSDVSVTVCKCDKPILIRTVHPLPDICDYCRKQILQTEH